MIGFVRQRLALIKYERGGMTYLRDMAVIHQQRFRGSCVKPWSPDV